MTPSDAISALDALRRATGQQTLAVATSETAPHGVVGRIHPCVRRGVDTDVAMTFAPDLGDVARRAADGLARLSADPRPMAWLHAQHAWIGGDDPDAPFLLLPLRGGRRPAPKARPALWAKARPMILPALAALPHGGRWRLPLAATAHARLATGLTTAALEAMADAFGPALGGADAVEILAQHGLVALRPTGPRFPLAILTLPGQPGAPRRPPIILESP